MNREILFRGKTVDKGKWVYGEPHFKSINPHIHDGFSHKEFIDVDTVGQYTGLKDDTDKEIYEGDVIDFTHYYEDLTSKTIRSVVCFENGDFCVKNKNRISLLSSMVNEQVCLVIGNIFDNPELIK